MKIRTAQNYALTRLATELPVAYTYHSLEHTRQVMAAAAEFSGYAGQEKAERALLVTAAAFHDLGYLSGPKEHEAASVRIAESVLPNFGFEPEAVAFIADLIRATDYRVELVTESQKVLRDADLERLGTPDFARVSELLRQELEQLRGPFSDREWLDFEIDFLARTRYQSRAGIALREAGRAENLRQRLRRRAELS